MRRTLPLTLILLMLLSSLASLPIAASEETDTNGRQGSIDAEVLSVSSPRASSVDPTTGEVTNGIKAGDDVPFVMAIRNNGDAAITELGASVQVWTASNGQPNTMLHEWTNDLVVCDICEISSLASGDMLSNGKYTFGVDSGQGLTTDLWDPAVGNYIVRFIVDAGSSDSTSTNDEFDVPVTVSHWQDIIVDLTWDDAPEEDAVVGEGPHPFTLSVTVGGSTQWSARNVSVTLGVEGQADAVTLDVDGASQTVTSSTTLNPGTTQDVPTYRNESVDSTGNASVTELTNPRVVLNYDPAGTADTHTYTGTVMMNGSASLASATISARMVSYTGYGQFPECVETEDDRGSNTTTVWNNFCEVDFQYDDVASTSVDELDASTSNFHDIAVTQVVVAQGYATETSDNPTFLRDGTSTIDVGFSRLHATVEHRGTTPSKTYDWTVQFVVTDESDGSTTTYDANECATGVPPPYQHAVLGEAEPPTDPSQPPVLSSIVGYACVVHTFGPGDYGITATISMVNSDVTDMKGSNDMGGINVQAVNNAPTVTLTRTNTDVNVVFSEDPTPFTDASMTKGPVMFTADCLDADDLSGTSLTYAWEHGSNAIEGAGGMGPQASALPMDIRAEHVGTDYVTVTCTDEYGATANAQVSLEVWNSALAVGQAGDITLEYDLIFDGPAYAVGLVASTQTFGTVPTNALSDNNLASTSNLPVLQAYDFTPSTTWNELLLNEFSVTFDPNTVAATSLWMVDTNNDWVRLAAAVDEGSTTANSASFTVTLASTSPTLNPGTLLLVGGEAAAAQVPSASVSGMTAEAAQGGAILISMTKTGTMVAGDEWVLRGCAAGASCTAADAEILTRISEGADQVDFTYRGSLTTHDTTYDFHVAICNEIGCNPTVRTATATADAQVDPAPQVSSIIIEQAGTDFTLSWQLDSANSDVSDVAFWKVCYGRDAFTANEMAAQTCIDTTSSDLSATVAKPTTTSTVRYHFSVAPVDALGNIADARSTNDITVTGTITDPGTTDGQISDGVESDGGLPGWTFPAIGGVVLVAIGAGAFIILRGDGDDGGGEDWDY